MLNNKQLKCFVTLAEELNFRRAAERLFMTQPPLTRHIQRLEEILNVKLFERDTGGVTLTAAGATLLIEARALLERSDLSLLKDKLARSKTKALCLRVGVTTSVDTSVFRQLTHECAQQTPALELVVKRDISINLIKSLQKNKLDVALLGLPSETHRLSVEKLYGERMVIAMPSTHALARQKRVSLLELQSDTVFMFARKRNPAYHDHCERVYKQLGFDPRRAIEPDDHHVLIGLVADGHGIGIVPASMCAIRRDGLTYKTLIEGDMLAIGIGLAHREDSISEETEIFKILCRKFLRAVSGEERHIA